MSTVKTYQGHDVPEGATGFIAGTGLKISLFVKDGFFVRTDSFAWKADESPETNGPIEELPQEPQEPEQYIPVVGEECEALLEGEWLYAEALKHHASSGAIAFDFGDCLKWSADFRPIKTKREKIKEWVESKIDCTEDFQMDQAIMINKMLDLGCLVIPESDK